MRQLGAGLFGDHVAGVPVRPVLVRFAAALLVLAVGDGGAAHGVGEVVDGRVAGVVRVDAPGQAGGDLLEQPRVAVGVAEGCERAVARVLGRRAAGGAVGAEVEDVADLGCRDR